MKKILPLILLSFFSITTQAQDQNLPHWMTDEEKLLLPAYLQNQNMLRGTDAPAFVPRAMAEWEEIQGLMVTWTDYVSIVRQIVDIAQEECTVYIVCSDSETVKSNLTSNNIPLYNIKYLDVAYNSIWCRDYGQWNIYKNDVEELSLVDWIYNRPRPKDDVVPVELSEFTGLPLYSITAAPYDLVHTGGNFMVDGHGTGFSSKLILDENAAGNEFDVTVKSEADIDTIMKKYLGLTRYALMETLPYDEIHHIDMHMKLLDEETLLWGEFPDGVSDGPQIEANLQYIQDNYLSCYGRPYKIVRIPMVPGTNGNYPPSQSYRTYANAVFINKTILIPTYREEYDTTAVRIYKENLPGYKVATIDCDNNGGNIIAALGAVHCITKEIGHSDPIWIDHAPLLNTTDVVNPYLVEAKIKTPSGITNATLYWTLDTNVAYTAVNMLAEPTDSFFAYIPAQPAGTEIFYYINAESNSGRNISKPITAPDGFMKFEVIGASNIAATNQSVVLFDIYPNPVSETATVGFVIPNTAHCSLIVTDVLGREMKKVTDGILTQGIHKITISTLSLSSGIYNVVLKTNGRIYSKKMVKE